MVKWCQMWSTRMPQFCIQGTSTKKNPLQKYFLPIIQRSVMRACASSADSKAGPETGIFEGKKNCGQRWTWIGHRKATDRKSYKWEMKWQNWKRRGRIGNQWKWTGIKEGIHSFMEKENANKWGTEWTKNGSESCREKVDNKQARGWHLNAKTQSGIPGSAVYDGNSKNHWHTKNSWFPRKNSYPLVNIQKAIENGHRNSGFTMIYPLKMVDLSIVMWQFTRGYLSYGTLRHRSSLLQFFRSSENRLTVGPPAHRNKRWKRWPPGADGQFVKSPSKGVGKPGVSFFGIENHYPLVI